MSVAARLTAFAAAALLVFVGAYGVGAAVGPVDDEPTGGHRAGTTQESPGGGSDHRDDDRRDDGGDRDGEHDRGDDHGAGGS